MTLQEPDTLVQAFFCMMCPACFLQWLFLHHTHHTDSYNMAFSPCSSAYCELAVPRGTWGFGYPFWKGVSLIFILRNILSARCWIKILSSWTILSFIGRWEVCISQGNNRGHHPVFALQKLSIWTCVKTDEKLPCPAQLCTAPIHTATTPSSGWMSVSVLQLPSSENAKYLEEILSSKCLGSHCEARQWSFNSLSRHVHQHHQWLLAWHHRRMVQPESPMNIGAIYIIFTFTPFFTASLKN